MPSRGPTRTRFRTSAAATRRPCLHSPTRDSRRTIKPRPTRWRHTTMMRWPVASAVSTMGAWTARWRASTRRSTSPIAARVAVARCTRSCAAWPDVAIAGRDRVGTPDCGERSSMPVLRVPFLRAPCFVRDGKLHFQGTSSTVDDPVLLELVRAVFSGGVTTEALGRMLVSHGTVADIGEAETLLEQEFRRPDAILSDVAVDLPTDVDILLVDQGYGGVNTSRPHRGEQPTRGASPCNCGVPGERLRSPVSARP